MTRISSPRFEAFLQEVDARENCRLRVRGDRSLSSGLHEYKVYVDGNVRTTPPRFIASVPEGEVVIALQEGVHRVVVREKNAHDPNRRESSTLYLAFVPEREVILMVSLSENALLVEAEA